MAKTNMLMREKRRLKVAKKYAARRAELKELIRDPKTGAEEREKAQAQPRDAAASRQRNRCSITGRSRGVYRKFGLARTKLREAANRGEIPGLSKASW
jgi:small subunit ribosomal protein S14